MTLPRQDNLSYLRQKDMATPSIPASTTITVLPTNTKPSSLPSTLKSLSLSGKLDEALHLIESHPLTPLPLQTYDALLHACISRKSLHHGQRLQNHLLLRHSTKGKKGRGGTQQSLLEKPALKTKLITLYSVCGRIDLARSVFDSALVRTAPESVWVAMAIGYSRNGCSKDALSLYVDMLRRFVQPGNFAFSAALKSCAELGDFQVGRAVHAQIVKCKDESDQVVYNALLRLYLECGCFEDVVRVFAEMPERNIVSWNSLVSGFAGRGQLFEAFDAFRRMQGEGVGFNWVSLTAVLPVCAQINALCSGKEIHAQMAKSVTRPDMFVLNSLMDMYAKCGVVDYARRIFDGMERRDLTSWNTVLNGYAIARRMEEGLKLFDKMVDSGFSPDTVTFIALLSGCSHTGLTQEGLKLFHRMRTEFGISPSAEHYACLVDMLGRAGRLKEALKVVKSMGKKPSGSIWGSLLNSCRLYGNVPLAEAIAKVLFEIEPKYPVNYVMLSNIYANAGLWEGVKIVREMMEKRGVKKEVGCSWIEIKNRLHTFVAGGGIELRNSEKYQKLWSELMEAMRGVGYKPDTRVVLHDVSEEIKKGWVCGHSERLAAMFGLIHTRSGIPLRITNNLRVCADCHSWMKALSQVTRRVIVLRDTKHFHHFEKGSCSCNDYW
ncbi:pentatricopeptide repeat-containing protein At3g14330 [Rhododendron vialii]|uniref:pentatricopeptide repeat-containing protein At3g14330 n=1 Tax=Rhododendron vialii TaxID=182163 RepID=UPI00265E9C4F|nr:pentatricopeptide repeat-containing protein At3g14330 [Rhododendron vialii]